MLLVIHLSRVLTSFRMLYPGPTYSRSEMCGSLMSMEGMSKGLRTMLILLPRIEIRAQILHSRADGTSLDERWVTIDRRNKHTSCMWRSLVISSVEPNLVIERLV